MAHEFQLIWWRSLALAEPSLPGCKGAGGRETSASIRLGGRPLAPEQWASRVAWLCDRKAAGARYCHARAANQPGATRKKGATAAATAAATVNVNVNVETGTRASEQARAPDAVLGASARAPLALAANTISRRPPQSLANHRAPSAGTGRRNNGAAAPMASCRWAPASVVVIALLLLLRLRLLSVGGAFLGNAFAERASET